MKSLLILLLLFASAGAQTEVSFASDGGATIYADVYAPAKDAGAGEQGVVLAHGGRYTKESWKAQAEALARAGFRVLAFDFRGHGKSTWPGAGNRDPAHYPQDVLSAVRYLKKQGAKKVSVVGGSMGGSAAAEAAIASGASGRGHSSESPEIHRLVLLAAPIYESAEKLNVPVLFIVAEKDIRGDGKIRLDQIRANLEAVRSSEKLLHVVSGMAHAQALFQTEHADAIMRRIIGFLKSGDR